MNNVVAWLSKSEFGHLLVGALRTILDVLTAIFGLTFLILFTPLARFFSLFIKRDKPRLLWGGLPIKSISYTSNALRQAGYQSTTVVTDCYHTARKEDFDVNLHSNFLENILLGHLADTVGQLFYFTKSLFFTDIYHYFFDGGILRRTLLARWELHILRLAGKKIVLFPYGADAFVYDELDDLSWRHALLVNNAIHGNKASEIQSRIRRSVRLAHTVVGTIAHIDNLPRWDILPVVWYPFDQELVVHNPPKTSGTVNIIHAPNHRGAKGTEFLLEAVSSLKNQGFDIHLELVEGLSNEEAILRMSKADIVVDQLLVGYALTAIEALSMGKIVISGFNEGPKYDVFRRYSYLDECPIVPASPETIESVLLSLIHQRANWPELSKQAIEFSHSRHSYSACVNMWNAIYKRIWSDEEIDLINFYNPHIQNGDSNCTNLCDS